MVILFWEDKPRKAVELGEDVPCRGMVLAALSATTELSIWREEVEVVASDEILGHVDDGGCKGLLAMMVGGMLCHVPAKLLDF